MNWVQVKTFILLLSIGASLARDCKVDEAGYDYQGTISVTREGIACQAWSAQDPHSHSYDEDYMFVDGSVAAAGSFCRNPDDDESGGPWCYTVESGTRWDHCDIPICTDKVEEVEVQDCKFDEAGYDYQGRIAVTVEGIECQAWASDEPHSHSYDEDSYFVDSSVAAAENFCRNPDNSESGGPWCYTTESGTRWDHCDIPICTTDECKRDELGLGYKGSVAVTVDGTECQPWAAQEPHSHSYDEDDMFVDGSVVDAGNFCRNPGGDEPRGPWCYTMDSSVRWNYCDIVVCDVMPIAMSDTAHRFTLNYNNREYILETSLIHVALEAESFCKQYNMTLAPVEDAETLASLSRQLVALRDSGVAISEVATGQRSAVNVDRDVSFEVYNPAGWSCVTFVQDDDGKFKLVSKLCGEERSVLCSEVPSC